MQRNINYSQNSFLTASQLNSLSSADINRYCFINGKKEEWDSDFINEIVDNIETYELLKTLSGNPLSYIKTKLYTILKKWIPAGTKLNPRLLYTLQDILAQNEKEVRSASMTGKPNNHIQESCTKLTTIINKAFEYNHGV